jgi:DNA-3-methyladenine glycosylase
LSLAELLDGDVLTAAQGLLGRRLSSSVEGTTTTVLLTEVEAYDGPNDPASHAYHGSTARTEVMFGPSGRLYVYRSYGIHWCMNVVCGVEGTPSAVLLRGGVPLEGVETMQERRGRTTNLTDGPGKLCQALGVTGSHNGVDVITGAVAVSGDRVPGRIVASERIGISKATDRLWRFVLEPQAPVTA